MKDTFDVLVLGDVMLDQYYWGKTSRISPEAPVPIVNLINIENRMGGAANVALNIINAGGSVKIHGCIGDDISGKSLINLLKDNDISSELYIGDNPTTTKLRIMSMGQQLLRVDSEEQCSEKDSIKIINNFKNEIKKSKVVVISDYSKGVITNIKQIILEASKFSIPVIVDPKSENLEIYRSAFLITPNLKEFKNFHDYNEHLSLYDNALIFTSKYDIEWFVITMGSEGMLGINKNGTQLALNTECKDVVDVTGAGDTVLSYLSVAILNSLPMEDALIYANKAAGISVSKLGTAQVKVNELTFLKKEKIFNIDSRSDFIKEIKKVKEGTNKIVMTNGCFDILHPGHVDYLSKSKQLGDILIVAINSDRSISSLKGKSRPINSFEYRAKVLNSLEVVDYIVEFDQETPEELISDYLPDVLTKGSDYKVSDIAGSKLVISNGGDVILIDLVEGYSTTSVISKINEDK